MKAKVFNPLLLIGSHPLFPFCLAFFLVIGSLFEAREASAIESNMTPKWEQLTFDYSQDQLEYLKELPRSSKKITSKELSRLTKELFYLVDSAKLSAIDSTIMPAYIANAQKDFAWLSYLLTGELTGSLGPVTLWTLQLFVKEAEFLHLSEEDFDVFTSSLASLVVKKIAMRLEEERKQITDYPIEKGEGLWRPMAPAFIYFGLNFGAAKTWFLNSPKEYLAETPPSNPLFWKNQVEQVKSAQQNLDGQKVQAVFKWAGLTAVDAGKLEKFIYPYLEEKNLPVANQLYVRALYLSALADSCAACFNSKYTLWIMRPSQRDPAIQPLVVVPNHPSYPSGHSTISATASTVMSHIFPEDSEMWNQMAEEAGISRIWGGIHYPVDHQVGQELGKKVGMAVLQRTGNLREVQRSK